MDHEWVDMPEDPERKSSFVDAKNSQGINISTFVNIKWNYSPELEPKRCIRCGMKSFNGKPAYPDDCNTYIIRDVLES